MVATFAIYKARVVNQEDICKFLKEELTFANYTEKNMMIEKIVTSL